MEVKCEFKFSNWSVGSTRINLYTCTVSNLQITTPSTNILAFDGIHLNGMSHKDVEAIKFLNGNILYFPRGVPEIFPQIRVICANNCELEEISDLRGFQSLETLWMQSNKLKSLPSDLLVGMNKLKIVSFYGNQIESLSSHILEPVKNNEMTRIDFRFNTSINALYKPGEDGSVSSIEELMELIDTQCTGPDEDSVENVVEGSIEAFNISTLSAVSELWNSNNLTDFTIIVGEKEFRVHKFILAAHSLKFKAMFNDKENEINELKIKDLDIEVVETFLRFFYMGKVTDNVDAMELFALSSKLEIPVLKSICENMIIESLQESNALKILNLGHAYDCEVMKKEAFDEIRRNFPDVELSDDFMEKPENLKKLIEAKQLYESMKAQFKQM